MELMQPIAVDSLLCTPSLKGFIVVSPHPVDKKTSGANKQGHETRDTTADGTEGQAQCEACSKQHGAANRNIPDEQANYTGGLRDTTRD